MHSPFLFAVAFDDGWLSILRSTVKPAPLMAMVIVLATCLQVMATHPMIARTVR